MRVDLKVRPHKVSHGFSGGSRDTPLLRAWSAIVNIASTVTVFELLDAE